MMIAYGNILGGPWKPIIITSAMQEASCSDDRATEDCREIKVVGEKKTNEVEE